MKTIIVLTMWDTVIGAFDNKEMADNFIKNNFYPASFVKYSEVEMQINSHK